MRIISSQDLYKGYFSLKKYELTDGSGIIIDREVFEHPNGACSIVYDTVKEKYIFVSQYRVAAKMPMIEVVAGSIDGSDSPENTIIREIGEELGYKVDRIRNIGEFFVSPGSNTEKVFLFYCEVSEKMSEGGGVDGESISVIEADSILDNGDVLVGEECFRLYDAKSLLGCLMYENNRN